MFPELKSERILRSIQNALIDGQFTFMSHALKQSLFPFFYYNEKGQKKDLLQKIKISPLEMNNRIYALIQIFNETQFVEKEKLLRKQKDDLKKSNNTKDKFFSIIAHDLRSPITGLFQLTELLYKSMNDYDEHELARLLEAIYLQSKRIFNLNENLLNWARTQIGKIIYHPEKINVNEIIIFHIHQAQESIRKKNIDVNFDPPDKNFNIHVDKNMISTVIRNILSNAIKFSYKKGKIDIQIKEDSGYIKISFTDFGVGMSKDVLDSLFDPAVHHTTLGTENEKGTGLGLLLCSEFIEINKGRIEVQSDIGKGSTFSLYLPMND